MEKNGGRPKKETIGFNNKKTIGFEKEETKTKPNVNVNENVNDNKNANVNANDSRVDGLQDVIKFYENNIGLITPFGISVLEDYLKEMPKELVVFAMQKAVEADKRTIQYIKGILNNWSKKGINTLLQARKEDEKFKKNKAEKKGNSLNANYIKRDYDNLDFLYANKGADTA